MSEFRRNLLINLKEKDYSKLYFTIRALSDGYVDLYTPYSYTYNTWAYSINGKPWVYINSNTRIYVSTKDKIRIKCISYLYSYYNAGFNSSCLYEVFGNIMSLLYGDDFKNKRLLYSQEFRYLFEYNRYLSNAENLIFPINVTYRCYEYMFCGCSSLTTIPAILPATTLASYCYYNMFSDCTSLTTAPVLPATTLADSCYYNMFNGCKSLVTAPTLPATTLVLNCYRYMFYNCNKLNKIIMLATNISASNCLYYWVSGVSNNGTFIKNINMDSLNWSINNIPYNWAVEDHFTPTKCISLSITANNVSGRYTTTRIYYTAELYGYDYNNNYTTITKTGVTTSEEFSQNTSETETITRTISYTYMGITATTIITQGTWIDAQYTVDLNSNWQLNTNINPNSNIYDGVYESYSNYNVNSGVATMYIDIEGYTDFKLYIRSYAESMFDYVMVSQPDKTITGSTSYANTTLVKAHTNNSQNSGTSINNYKLVEFTGMTADPHRITIVYRKDYSVNSGTDRGYVLIPKNQ